MRETDALIQPDRGQAAIPIHLVNTEGFAAWAHRLTSLQRAVLAGQRFTGKAYEVGIVPAGPGDGVSGADDGGDGASWIVVGGVADPSDLSSWCLAGLAEKLPAGTYRLAESAAGAALHGWQAAQYRFDRYLKDDAAQGPRVLVTADADAVAPARMIARAVAWVRDMVNTPAEDMGPAALEAEAEALAKAHDAKLTVVRGEELQREYPMVHRVGRAAAPAHAPRLLHLAWGRADAPVLAVVGKGVCFDSGGLDIKNASGMLIMKKDMGGAAHALALAGLVMEAGLDVRLHCLVPAVENAISGDAFRPGDVLPSRAGITVEIGNTDAEGRLILADALTRASEEAPDLLIDFATLTGAARVALGPDLPALMARRDDTAQALIAAGDAHDDAVWRLPLPDAYREWLKSDVADMTNAPTGGFAGASVAGLFLDRFVGEGIDWAHFDTFAWRPAAKPGRPKGGEALGLVAAFQMLRARYG